MRRTVQSWSNGPLLKEAAGFAAQFEECLILGPRHTAGETLARGVRGSAGIHHLTPVQLAAELARGKMAAAGVAPLSGLAQLAIAARVIHRATTDNLLSYFKPVATLPGFARALARTLNDLRLAEVHATSFSGDVAVLLKLYESELIASRLQDLAGIISLARSVDSHRFLGLPLVLLDIGDESSSHQSFLDHVASRSPEVLVLERITDPAAGEANDSLEHHSLEHLRRNLFSPQSRAFASLDGKVELFSAPGEGLESVEIARRILKLAREGVAFDRVAILLRNPNRYQPMVEEALRRAGIPVWFSKGTVRPHVSGRAFLALLHCAAERLSASRFAEYLSLGQVPETVPEADWVAPEDDVLGPAGDGREEKISADTQAAVRATPWRWERLLVDAAVIGGRDRWERRLNGLEEEFKVQERDLEPLHNLKRFALPLIAELDALPPAAQWDEWLEKLAKLARQSLRDPEPVLAILAELAPMSEVGPVGLEEVAEVLSERLRFLRREPSGRRWGKVFVGSIEEARGRAFDIVFLPGLAEGLFPQRASEDPLLLDELRRAISDQLPLRSDIVHSERELLHLAAAAASERLIVSYPRMEVAEARPRVPSFYALEIPRAVRGSLPELKAFEDSAREAAPARLNWPAPRDFADAIDNAEFDLASIAAARDVPGAARYLVEVNENLARSLRGRWARWRPSWKSVDGLISSDSEVLAALNGERLARRPWSPSALEQFTVCPYKFALHGIYRLRRRDEAVALEQLDPLTRGALFHEVQHQLQLDLREACLLPVTEERLSAVLARADEILARVAAKYEEKLAPAIPRVWTSEINDLRTDLRGWLEHIAANDNDWEPVHPEREFGPVTLREGVQLRGKVDIIERHVQRKALRITDHKTGKKPDMIPKWVGGGKHLQPLLYAIAIEQEMQTTVECARLLYATQKGGYSPVEIRLDDRARQILAALLANIDGHIETGFLPPAPEREACGWCDYRIVCGPYEERRVAKKDRRDPRLEPLIEIRGMA